MSMNDTYQPINCDDYDNLELACQHHLVLTLALKDGEQLQAKASDLISRKNIEYLVVELAGNVRELRALVQSLATMSEEETITMQDLPQYMQAQSPLPQGSVSFRQPMREAVAELERNMIMTALTETGSTYKAARRLKVSQSTIVRKAQRYKIGLVEIAHK